MDHGAPEQLAKVGEDDPRVQRWLEFLTAHQYAVRHRRRGTNRNAKILSRLPLPSTAVDLSPACRLTEPDEPGIYPIRRAFSARKRVYTWEALALYRTMQSWVGQGLRPPISSISALLVLARTCPPISAPPSTVIHLSSDNTRSRFAACASPSRALQSLTKPTDHTRRAAPGLHTYGSHL